MTELQDGSRYELAKVPEGPLSETKLWFEQIQPLLAKGRSVEEIAQEIVQDVFMIEDIIERWTRPYSVLDGPQLFKDTRSLIALHYYFEESWHYTIVTLFVFEAKCALALPAVFYLFFGGAKGSGKSNILDLLCTLTRGLKCENISVSALARSMENGRAVFVDEIDADRGKENNEVRDALLRQGYKANAAPYMRWDAAKKKREEIEIYGPKAATYRSGLNDDALRDRGFQIPTVKATGESGYDYVLRNLWQNTEDIPKRLDEWSRSAVQAFPRDKLKEIAYSAEFKKKVKRVVEELGANRESELVTIALLVAEMAGVDVVEELNAAVRTRETSNEDTADDLEALSEVVQNLAETGCAKTLVGSGLVRIKQSLVKHELNRRRKEQNDRPISDRRLAMLRRELGVSESWLSKPGNAVIWNLPERFVADLRNKANMANPDSVPDWCPGSVNQVDLVSKLREDAGVLSYDELVARYGKDLVEREKIPVLGGER